jgi:hypothetical protein
MRRGLALAEGELLAGHLKLLAGHLELIAGCPDVA